MIDVRLLDKGFSPGKGLARLAKAHPEAGGLASFVGKVRGDDGVKALQLMNYEPLTLPGMESLAEDALSRWNLDAILIWHRVGIMRPNAPIVLVSAASRHRRDALQAVDFAMDNLKSAALQTRALQDPQTVEDDIRWCYPATDLCCGAEVPFSEERRKGRG